MKEPSTGENETRSKEKIAANLAILSLLEIERKISDHFSASDEQAYWRQYNRNPPPGDLV
ncbi:MAG: hypothetical protein KTR24_14840 [Saprospiraceae bacterium]|nr:hypothetical protein [Saprospiraceae bacterium]